MPIFLPGESHGWRSLLGYSPRGGKESDTTERLDFTHLPHKVLMFQVGLLVPHRGIFEHFDRLLAFWFEEFLQFGKRFLYRP